MNPISLLSLEDIQTLFKTAYGKGAIVILGESGKANDLKGFPEDDAVWTELPMGTVLMSGTGTLGSVSGTNSFTLSAGNIPQLTTYDNSGHSHSMDIQFWHDQGNKGIGLDRNWTQEASQTYWTSTENSHTHKVGSANPTAINLESILKHPLCYFYQRIQ